MSKIRATASTAEIIEATQTAASTHTQHPSCINKSTTCDTKMTKRSCWHMAYFYRLTAAVHCGFFYETAQLTEIARDRQLFWVFSGYFLAASSIAAPIAVKFGVNCTGKEVKAMHHPPRSTPLLFLS